MKIKEGIKWVAKRIIPQTELDFLLLRRLSRRARKMEDTSFANERITLENLVNQLGISAGFVVDVAAADGISQSCTLGLFSNRNWSGLAVELNSVKFFRLSYIYASFPNVKLSKVKVTPDNVVNLLKAHEVPRDFDVLNLDIDSYDLHVAQSMLFGGYNPKIITMEINEKIPSGIYFTVDFDKNHHWQGDHFYGCSLDAACELVKNFGYLLFKLEYNNALFVKKEFAPKRFTDLSAREAFYSGYQNKSDRQSKFPWNSDVDYWLELPAPQAIEEITSYFQNYYGKFTIRPSGGGQEDPRPV